MALLKLLIFGDGGRKTTFMKRFLGGESVEVYPLDIFTNLGKIRFRFNCWILRAREVRNGGQCTIIMFDVTAISTYKNVLHGLAFSAGNWQVKAKEVTFHREKNLPYYEISAKSNYNIEKHLMESPALAHPEVHIDLAARQQHEAELAFAAG
ncbi:hypothetical protein ACJRO7_016453 [Eucalyptus globulus]|uniref:Uncharacterized protein n=1 Tax=Eucalyptus globulus TaxID=34317 RepID=A0ABD3LCT9_EUCGL